MGQRADRLPDGDFGGGGGFPFWQPIVQWFQRLFGNNTDNAVTASQEVVGLGNELARKVVTSGTGIQHGFRHVNEWLGLGNWDNASREVFRGIVEKVLTKPDAVVRAWEMSRGKQVVDVFLQKIGDEWVAVYYNPATQQVVTTTKATVEQLTNWGVK